MALSQRELQGLNIDDFLQKKPPVSQEDLASPQSIESLDLEKLRERDYVNGTSGRPQTQAELSVLDQAMQVDRQRRADLLASAKPKPAASPAAPPPSAMTPSPHPNNSGNLRRMEYNSHESGPSWGAGGLLPHVGPAIAAGAQGVGNWLAGIGEAFMYGTQGLSVQQGRLMKAQAQEKQLQVQVAMQMKQAKDSLPALRTLAPTLQKNYITPLLKKKEAEAKAANTPFVPGTDILNEAAQIYNQDHPQNPLNSAKVDAMMLLPEGRMLFPGMFDPETQSKMYQDYEQMKQKDLYVQQQKIKLDALMGPVVHGPQQAGNRPEVQYLSQMGEQLVRRSGMDPLDLQQMMQNKQGPAGMERPLQNMMTGAMEQMPVQEADMAKITAQEGVKSRFEEQRNQNQMGRDEQRADNQLVRDVNKAELQRVRDEQIQQAREKEATQKSQDAMNMVDRRGVIQGSLVSQRGITAQALHAFDADMRNTRDRERGAERINEIRFKIENRPEASMSLQDKMILSMVNGAMAGERVDATNLSKNLRQIAALTHDDEKTVLSTFMKSGAVNTADLWKAAAKVDKDLALNPEKEGSQTKLIFDALQEVQAERQTEPLTDAVNYALTAKDNPNKVSELIRLMNQWETRLDGAKTPEEKAKWEKGIRLAENSLQRIEVAKTGGRIRGNALFQSASQPVKDVLLSQKGDLMENATYSDVEKAIETVQKKAIERNIAGVEGGKQKTNLYSAGKVLATLTTLQQLGQDLFSDTMSGRFGSGSRASLQSAIKTDDRYVLYEKLRTGLVSLYAKGISGNVGSLSDKDIERAETLTSSPSFGWFSMPDSKAQFNKNIDLLKDSVRILFDKDNLDALDNIERDFSNLDQRDPQLQSVLANAKKAAAAAAAKK